MNGWPNPQLRRWTSAAALLSLVGLAGHLIGGRSWDPLWLLLSVVAAVVPVVGSYRSQQPDE